MENKFDGAFGTLVPERKTRNNCDPSQLMTYESILNIAGGFGNYQYLMLTAYALNLWTFSFIILFMVFGGVGPVEPVMSNTNSSIANANKSDLNTSFNGSLVYHFYSVVEQWNLVTPQLKSVPNLINSLQAVGLLTGPLISGILCDRYGRRKTIIVVLCFTTIGILSRGFSTSWQMFTCLSFFLGGCAGALLSSNFVYFMEHCIASRRILFAITGWYPGCILFGLAALATKDWHSLNFVPLVFVIPSFLIVLFLKPSPKWNIGRKDLNSARDTFVFIAKFNKVLVDPDLIEEMLETTMITEIEHTSNKTYNYWHIFYSKKATLHGVAIMAGWSNGTIVYYIITYGISTLAGNLYVNYLTTNVMIYVVCLSASVLDLKFERLGRRCFLLPCICAELLCLIFVTFATVLSYGEKYRTAVTAVTLLGLLFGEITWIPLEMVLAEFYPTEIRTIGYTANNFCARCMMILAPQVMLLSRIWPAAPFVIMTVTTVTVTIYHWLYFPETKNCDLPDLPPGKPLSWCCRKRTKQNT